MRKKNLIFFILIILIFGNCLSGQEFNYSIDTFFIYRTAEVIEIIGNEDTMNFYSFLDLTFTADNFLIFSQLELSPLSSEKSRFADIFKKDYFVLKELYFQYFIGDLSINAGYMKNFVLNYNYESYNLPIIYRFYSYPDENNDITSNDSIPYMTFILGNRHNPIYYTNAIHEFDTFFYLNYSVARDFNIYLGISNGEEGLDSNSAKSVVAKIKYESDRFNFSMAALIGNRGSIPAKVYSHQYSTFIEYNYQSSNFNFICGMEGVFTIHGFTKSYVNPYDSSFNNYNTSSHDFQQYNWDNGYFMPDDLPNLYDLGKPLYGAGGFIYLRVRIHSLKVFSHFSLYDSNVMAGSYTIYKIRWKILSGFEYYFTNELSFVFSYSYTKDPVHEKYVQIYEAEPRSVHPIIDYDLFFAIRLQF